MCELQPRLCNNYQKSKTPGQAAAHMIQWRIKTGVLSRRFLKVPEEQVLTEAVMID